MILKTDKTDDEFWKIMVQIQILSYFTRKYLTVGTLRNMRTVVAKSSMYNSTFQS